MHAQPFVLRTGSANITMTPCPMFAAITIGVFEHRAADRHIYWGRRFEQWSIQGSQQKIFLIENTFQFWAQTWP